MARFRGQTQEDTPDRLWKTEAPGPARPPSVVFAGDRPLSPALRTWNSGALLRSWLTLGRDPPWYWVRRSCCSFWN
jgi:hypothetical protein